MKHADPEMHLNETYFVEVTKDGSMTEPRRYFPKVGPHYVPSFPFPKDNAIRRFHQLRHALLASGETVELWRESPALVLCAESVAGKLEMFPVTA